MSVETWALFVPLAVLGWWLGYKLGRWAGRPPRCAYCRRIIWPWQSSGWITLKDGAVRWHGRCYPEDLGYD